MMSTNTKRYIGWCAILFLLTTSIYCEFKLGNSMTNAFLDVVLTFVVFYIGYNDAKKKHNSQQNRIDELQQRVNQLEAQVTNPNKSDEVDMSKSTGSIDWEHAIKR